MFERIVTDWYESIYDVMAEANRVGLVLCGTGYWCEKAIDICKVFDVRPVAVCTCEETLPLTEICGYKVVRLEKAVSDYHGSIFISCADQPGERNNCNRVLKRHGVLTKESGLLFWRYAFLLDTGLEILNYTEKSSKSEIQLSDVKNILFFNHMERSGSTYFQEIIDGHPEILLILMLGATFKTLYERRFIKLRTRRLCMEICAFMATYFKTSLDMRDRAFPETTVLSSKDYLVGENGEFDWRICIEPNRFYFYLSKYLNEDRKYEFAEILKAVFVAYANAVGRTNPSGRDLWIAYDLHDPAVSLDEFLECNLDLFFEKTKYCYLVRNPIQHLASEYKEYVLNMNDDLVRFRLISDRVRLWIEAEAGHYADQSCVGKIDSFVIRFEDLKKDSQSVMKNLCKRLDIGYSNKMKTTTINNITMYNRKKTSNGYRIVGGHDVTSVNNTNYDGIFSQTDLGRLKCLFSTFIRAYYLDEYEDNYVEYGVNEMTRPYVFLDNIVERVENTGDANGEGACFKNNIYTAIEEQMRKMKNGRVLIKLL